jgi:hypothetical protein
MQQPVRGFVCDRRAVGHVCEQFVVQAVRVEA